MPNIIILNFRDQFYKYVLSHMHTIELECPNPGHSNAQYLSSELLKVSGGSRISGHLVRGVLCFFVGGGGELKAISSYESWQLFFTSIIILFNK